MTPRRELENWGALLSASTTHAGDTVLPHLVDGDDVIRNYSQ